ncbi:serine hydrolase domain-containing protein [Massilia sp. YIM B02763]|uniref:serine hydrolase domain-containing protein n=1 Tax=Massilia sp. YIM B02763 TaxID=3050130 RepID=UPI0025B6F7B6|nr:serine hydrolase domain-containing protein [Massilia sp. YIM B02763]MDN4053993.1 serine hydrolase domain-containing protein [Massilia sp. YIM B02763]
MKTPGRKRYLRALLSQLTCLLVLCANSARADDIDDLIKAQMREHRIPGLSLAVVSKGAIVREGGFGLISGTGQTAVTPATLFQAASISKTVAALGALRLVESGQLQLDENVNRTLRTLRVPDNEFTRDSKVTLRGILSNSGGLGVLSFPGYAAGAPIPTLEQVLDGKAPANTPAVRVEYVPRSQWHYSGGGHAVLQQLMSDASGKPFAGLMRDLVLAPLDMTRSTFEQQLPAAWSSAAASGHVDGQPLPGGRHVYPELAAAGLWTTAPDLARFAIGLQRSFEGRPGAVISQQMAKEMMSRQIRAEGLGIFVMGVDNRAPSLWYAGRNRGFDAFLWFAPASGDGIVIMINANDNDDTVKRIARSIAVSYKMTGFPFP